jgi:hypothetical protein
MLAENRTLALQRVGLGLLLAVDYTGNKAGQKE